MSSISSTDDSIWFKDSKQIEICKTILFDKTLNSSINKISNSPSCYNETYRHSMRVAANAKNRYSDSIAECSGYLHDLVEDGFISYEELWCLGVDRRVINVVTLLTRVSDQTYEEYIQNICNSKNKFAMFTKLADLEDNLNFWRMAPAFYKLKNNNKNKCISFLDRTSDRMKKYMESAYSILSAIDLLNIDIEFSIRL